MHTENKEDRRVRKTKKVLRKGLIELLNEKSIQKITIRELTDKVDIHRSTFYANFNDIYDLYCHMEDTVVQEIIDIVSEDYAFNPYILWTKLVDYINRNRQLSRLFFSGNINTAFFERLIGLFKNMCIDCWRKEYHVTNTSDEMNYYAQYCLSGGLGIIGMWVSANFEYPADKLVTMLAEIDVNAGKMFGSKFS